MEDETEPNVYDQYEEYVKQVEVKQSDEGGVAKYLLYRVLLY